MLIPITKVEIVGLHDQVEAVLDALHRLRMVQFVDLQDEGMPLRNWSVQDDQVRRADEWRLLEARLDALLGLFPRPHERDLPAFPLDEVDALRVELDRLAPEVEALVGAIDALRAEKDTLPRHIGALRKLMPLVPAVVELERYETIALLLDAKHPGVLDLLRRELEELVGARFAVVSARVDADTVGAILAFPRAESARVHSLLGRERVSQVHLPVEYGHMPLGEAVAAMEGRLAALPARIGEKEAELAAIVGAHAERWTAARELAAGRVDQLAEIEKLGTTGHAFVLRGWTPARDVPRLAAALAEEIGPALVVREVPLTKDERDKAPVMLEHRGLLRPFGFLLEMFALPRTGALDPTWMMALLLPVFFGMMLGDVGYAVVLALVALGVRRAVGPDEGAIRHLTTVLLLGSAWSAVFGVLFGEYFGGLGAHLGLHPLWLDREHAVVPLLVVTVGVGAAHILLGLVLGVWSAARRRQAHHLAERSGLLLALLGGLVLVGAGAGVLPGGLMAVGGAAIGLGAVGVLWANGSIGLILAPLEVVKTFGNVLSYLRIAALGLASVYLARAANELGAMLPLWIGILVAVLLHTVNLVLGAFSPTIQSLRLHYVEFFGQFYEDGGKPFQPFGASPREPGGGARSPREEATWKKA